MRLHRRRLHSAEVLFVLALAHAGCSDAPSGPTRSPSPPPETPAPQSIATVSAVVVSGDAPRIGEGSVSFTATAQFSNNTSINVTTAATWESSNTLVATVGPGGRVEAVGPGVADIRATYRTVSGVLSTLVAPVVFIHNTLAAPGATSYPGGYQSDQVPPYRPNLQVWDDFVASNSVTLKFLSWQGIYCRVYYPNDTTPPTPEVDSFRVSFYNDGTPGSMIGSEMRLPASQVNERFEANVPGQCQGLSGTSGLYSYSTILPATVDVTAGRRYWLSIIAVRRPPGDVFIWLWRYGLPDNNRATFDIPGLIGNHDLAFSLH
ncbi:MAG TPA: hypothetical protein VF456_29215 [Vicinamibacterales bacterium]